MFPSDVDCAAAKVVKRYGLVGEHVEKKKRDDVVEKENCLISFQFR